MEKVSIENIKIEAYDVLVGNKNILIIPTGKNTMWAIYDNILWDLEIKDGILYGENIPDFVMDALSFLYEYYGDPYFYFYKIHDYIKED